MKITFDKSAVKCILDIFDKTLDPHGFIVSKDEFEDGLPVRRKRVLTRNGEQIHVNEFAGIAKWEDGESEYFLSDIVSLVRFSDQVA